LSIAQRIVVAILAVGIMLIPVLLLFLDENLSREKMAGIVGAFVGVFMITICVIVDITPHDLFIGTAA
jgi:drug/metabolite transporter (DMT)-like permease